MERWDGHQGPGNLNAYKAMQRALELAEANGVGTVALSNTNHWMRGGNFGWQAAEAGKIGICWTNTMPNLPPWGSTNPLIGNNPLVIAVPRTEGHIVLDMAMSQYSYGALEGYASEGRTLPYPGGWDSSGQLSSDPVSILETKRPLPIGFWKGSGLSILLDLTAALLSGGKATHDIPPNAGSETGISQVFMAFSPPDHPGLADRVVHSLRACDEDVSYPGERTLSRRRESDEKGLPVSKDTWDKILAL
jgi:3-dehydro-L-gulonate 2-dehydrogenase